MSFNVADLVATLRMDSSDYDRGMSRSEQQANSFASTLKGKLGAAAQTGALALTGMGIAAGVTVAKVLQTGIAYNTLQQTSRAAMTTLLGGAKEANAQMDKLDVFAKTSPFSKSTFITAQQQLVGFGMETKKVIPTLDAINNAVAGIGGSNQDVGDLAFIIAQIGAAGKITGQDLLQFGGRGIQAADLIGKSLGRSGEDIKKSITDGTLDATVAVDALVKGMATKFAGASANVKQTMTGAADRVKSATRDIGAAMAEPFVSKYGGGRLVEWTNQWADALRKLEKNIPGIAGMLINRFAPGLTLVGTALSKLNDLAGGVNAATLTRFFDKLSANAPAVAVLTGAIAGLSASALAGLPIIGRFAAMLNPWVAIFIALAAASPELRGALGEVLGALTPLLPVVGKLATALSGALSSALTAAIPLVEGFASILSVIVAAAIPIISVVADLATGFTELPGGVQTAIVAVAGFLLLRGPMVAMLDVLRVKFMALASGGVTGALSKLLGIFGGPWGIAIGAAVAVLGFFAFKNKEASDAVKSFSQTLDENTGQITKNTYAKAAEELSKLSKEFKQVGLSTADAAKVAVDGGAAYDQVREKLNTLANALSKYQAAMIGTDVGPKAQAAAREELEALARTYGTTADAVEKLGVDGFGKMTRELEKTNGQVEKSKGVWADLNVSAQTAKPVTLELADAIKKVGDEASTSQDRISAYKMIIDAMNGVVPSAAESQRNLSKSTRDLAGFLGEVNEAGKKVNTGLIDLKTGAVANTEAGDQLNSMFQSMQQNGLAAATAASDLAKANGDSAGAAKAADQALAPFRQTLQGLADQGLMTQKEVDAVSKALFGVPGKTTAVITDNNSAPAVKLKVEELTRKIDLMPKGKQIMITEPQSPAIMTALHNLGYTVNTLPDGNVMITASGTALTKAQIEDVARAAWALDGTVSTVEIHTRYTSSDEPRLSAGRGGRGGQTIGSAEGNLLQYFAAGGIHPKLTPMSPTAQIVPKNTWRVVGDNMTHPELYAPLDGSSRSLGLMREGASRMGFDMVPRSAVRGYAAGAIASRTQTGAPSAPALGAHTSTGPSVVFTGPIYATDIDDVRAQSKQRQKDRNAVYGIGSIGTVG